MPGSEASYSRPDTPESSLSSSHDQGPNTVQDELTRALANVSRVPSPEPPSSMICCCSREECENTRAWQAMKARLESRLILSAKVGQALLQRHEAYVRKHERRQSRDSASTILDNQKDQSDSELSSQDDLDNKILELVRENVSLEKRLSQALVNNEVTEVSSKTILQELQEARTTISRLSAHHARSVGWDNRLSSAMKERDDMQQERDFESQRARLAESRFAALKDKTSKLQAEVRRLQDDLQERRMHRLESSEHLIQDARTRLLAMQAAVGPAAATEQTELTNVIESLVDDNEALKRNHAELQNLLAEAREEINALQEEVEEQRANPPSRAGTPHSRQHFYTNSMPSSAIKEQLKPTFPRPRRNSSLERKGRRGIEALTPETTHRPLSPTYSLASLDSKRTSFSHQFPTSPLQVEFQDDSQLDDTPSSPEKPRTHKPLFLLTRSRGIQTETWPGLLSPSPIPSSHRSSPSPGDPRSESSSFSESGPSNISILVERVVQLLNRMSQADALTLTNRLKRQNLRGADVGHLSRSTVSNVIAEAGALRTQFRALLEDDKIIHTYTRKDLRALFKLFRDIFGEMGQMRVTLNEIILDPSIAPKVSELALDPSKTVIANIAVQEGKGGNTHGGWMAPLSKLFSTPGGDRAPPTVGRSGTARTPVRPPQRFVPKLGPALSASATTVNVEFSGSGVGKSVTNTFSAQSSPGASSTMKAPAPSGSPGIMGIFAGAPQARSPDPWVVLPRGPRRVSSNLNTADSSPVQLAGPIPHRVMGNAAHRLSRNVDAVIDAKSSAQDEEDEDADYVAPLLERTLRRRGLSDSSIHSTYKDSQGEESRSSTNRVGSREDTPQDGLWPDRGSVLQALSKRVQNFRMGSFVAPSPLSTSQVGTSPPGPSTIGQSRTKDTKARPSLSNLIPSLAWAAGERDVDAMAGPEPFFAGSPRDESDLSQRTRRNGGTYGDYY